MIRQGRLVLVIGGQESQNLLKDYQARVHSGQMVLVIARREAGPCQWRPSSRVTFSEDAKMRV
jgi:hypothetical protein